MQWDALDREYHRVLANGMNVSHTWDAAGRETQLVNANAAGTWLFAVTNTYAANNNRIGVVELDGTQVQFSYDPNNQLLNEQRTGVNAYNSTYTWDPVGNRLQQNSNGQITTGSFNAANAQLTSVPSSGPATTNTWDPNGNLATTTTGAAITTNAWSPENRLSNVGFPDGTSESYTYSDDGLRKSKTNASGTTLFTWDEQNVLLETDTSLAVAARYTDYPGYWGGLASQNRSGVSSFYGFDSQGSTRILVSLGGVVTDNYSYTAFGVELQSGSGTVNPHGYIGKFGYWNDRPNMNYVRERLLMALFGAWMKRDTVTLRRAKRSAYSYAKNSPVVLLDPSGRVPVADTHKTSDIDPFPLSNPAGCSELSKCLANVPRCGKGDINSAVTPGVAICVFGHENPGGNPRGNGNEGGHEGIGNLTKIAFKELCRSNCSVVEDYCSDPPKDADYMRFISDKGGATPCEKAQAAFQYMMHVGLSKYGPPKEQGSYRQNLTLFSSVMACSHCVDCIFGNDSGALPPLARVKETCDSCKSLVRVHPYGDRKGFEHAF